MVSPFFSDWTKATPKRTSVREEEVSFKLRKMVELGGIEACAARADLLRARQALSQLSYSPIAW